MYSSDLKTRDRSGAIAAVIAIHAALLFAFLHLSGRMNLADPQSVLQVFDISETPPPPPIVDVTQPEQKQKPKAQEGAASPKNVKSQATPVVAPKPKVELPIPLPVNASQTPNQGAAPTQGASDVAGPGTGAGGTGTGTGSGGSGNGTGGGGSGLATTRARLAVPPLRGRDFPPQLLDAWPRGATIWMRVRVDPNGAVLQCIVDRGTGNPAFDSQICAIVQRRLRYYPGLNESSQRVADWAGYRQEPPH
jgi:protein TonB